MMTYLVIIIMISLPRLLDHGDDDDLQILIRYRIMNNIFGEHGLIIVKSLDTCNDYMSN